MNFEFNKIKVRTLLISASVLTQLAAVMACTAISAFYFPVADTALRWLRIAAALYIFSREMPASYKLSWLMLLIFAPRSGAVVYLIGGKMGLSRFFGKNRRSHLNFADISKNEAQLFAENDPFAPISVFLTRCAEMPPHKNTKCEFFPSGELLFKKLCEQLESAEKFIFMEYFIISNGALWQRIEKILLEKCKNGVEIRLLYDDAGSMNTLPRRFSKKLSDAGIKTAVFNRCRPRLDSAMNYRDHRKICVIDGNIGFCGGANIADEYINRLPRCSHWKDTGTMLRGEGVINLTRLFLRLWNEETGENLSPENFAPTESCISDGVIQPFGDSPLDDLYIAESICAMSAMRANRYIYITTPYLIPDDETVSALCRAAMSGVDVRLILPAVPDKKCVHLVSRGNYPVLLRHGVKIYEYTPGFIHCKQLVCDDSFAMVGTANMDHRSFFLHYEAAVCIFGGRTPEKIRQDIEAALRCCREITDSDIERLTLPKKLFRLILKLFSPLF